MAQLAATDNTSTLADTLLALAVVTNVYRVDFHNATFASDSYVTDFLKTLGIWV